jgi:hypothetical protein
MVYGMHRSHIRTYKLMRSCHLPQRICLWGNKSYGLETPPLVSGVPLFIRAVTNSTYGHHGEMALPQMLVANL